MTRWWLPRPPSGLHHHNKSSRLVGSPASFRPPTTTNESRRLIKRFPSLHLPLHHHQRRTFTHYHCWPPPTSQLTPHTTTTNRSLHLTPPPPCPTSPAPLSATGPVKQKKGSWATLLSTSMGFSYPIPLFSHPYARMVNRTCIKFYIFLWSILRNLYSVLVTSTLHSSTYSAWPLHGQHGLRTECVESY
jgi:hypothetical protein